MYFFKRVLFTFLLSCSLLVAVNYFSCSNHSGHESIVLGNQEESPLKNDVDVEKAWGIQKSFRKIYELYKDRVVYISTEQRIQLPRHPFYEMFGVPRVRKQTGLGSGFIISEDGFICTNYHVIAPNGYIVEKITVIIEGASYNAQVRGFDENRDITLLKIEPKKKLKPVYLGDSSDVKVGDWAVAIGNPFGLSKSFTVGVISATSRTNIDQEGGDPYFQTDVAINPGNSGGPLINIRGEVIGVNRLIFSKSGGYMGVGFAIPVNRVKQIINNLKKQKYIQKGFIGVSLLPVTKDIARQLRWNHTYGAVVENTLEGGPAQRAGLRRGDIIYGVNDKKVQNVNDLIDAIEKIGAGHVIKLLVWRSGRRMKFSFRIASRPAQPSL